MVNTYAVQPGGCRFESLWGFGFFLKGAHYEVDYSGKKTYLAGLQCTLTSSCAKSVFQKTSTVFYKSSSNNRKVVEKQKSTIFDIFGNFTQIQRKFDWLGYTQSDENTNRCLVSS